MNPGPKLCRGPICKGIDDPAPQRSSVLRKVDRNVLLDVGEGRRVMMSGMSEEGRGQVT